MATRSVVRTKSARDYHTQNAKYLYRRVDFNTLALNSSGKCYVGVLPADAYPFETVVRINTSFDQPLIVGTAASTAADVGRLDVEWGSTGVTHVDKIANTAYSSADVNVFVMASTVPTVGQADIWVRYLDTKG